MRFTRIHLDNWRNFRAVDVALEQRVFLVGPNAAGKSNFLDSIKFLRDVAAVGGGLQVAVERRGGVSRVRSLAARAQTDIGISVEVSSNGEGVPWRYELEFGHDRKRRAFLKVETVWRNGRRIHHRPDKADQRDPERRTQTSLEQVNANQRFRELAEFFASVQYLHIVPQLIREPERSVGRRNDPFGGDFLDQVASTTKKTRDARLRRILRAARVAVPQLEELRLEPDTQGAWHLRGKYQHWRAQGAWQTEQELSDGTLRLFGLLWAALNEGGPLLLEEPELSLHPEVVRRIPQMFARIQGRLGRQIILSTHSSDLLADPGIGIDEVLLLEPQSEGTLVRPAAAFFEIPELLAGGLTLAEAVLPRTRPKDVEQLSLFGG